jgi:hypothetical protein
MRMFRTIDTNGDMSLSKEEIADFAKKVSNVITILPFFKPNSLLFYALSLTLDITQIPEP